MARRTYGPSDLRTDPLIEMPVASKKKKKEKKRRKLSAHLRISSLRSTMSRNTRTVQGQFKDKERVITVITRSNWVKIKVKLLYCRVHCAAL